MNTISALRTIVPAIFITLLTSGSSSIDRSLTVEYKTLQNAKKTRDTRRNETTSFSQYYLSDFQKFVKEADSKISSNEKKIAKLKSQLQQSNIEGKNITTALSQLELKNSMLKSNLEIYVQNGTGNWKEFRDGFYKNLSKFDLAYNQVSK